MTSVCNEDGLRWIGMTAGENIRQYTLQQGAQLWYRNIEIDGRMCHAYIIPIVQPSAGTVVGALMALFISLAARTFCFNRPLSFSAASVSCNMPA